MNEISLMARATRHGMTNRKNLSKIDAELVERLNSKYEKTQQIEQKTNRELVNVLE